jgi:hypothetical protein
VQRSLDGGTGKNHDQQRDQQHPRPAPAVDSAVAAASALIGRRHEISVVMKWACH